MTQRKILRLVLGCGLLMVVGLTAGPSMAADHVPFWAQAVETYREFEPGTGRVIGTYTQTLEGFGSHVGAFTTSSTTTLTRVGPDVYFEGDGTVVTTNGDELYIRSWGRAWDGNGEGWFEITGGTGKFEGASGFGTQIVTMSDDDVQSVEFDGHISY